MDKALILANDSTFRSSPNGSATPKPSNIIIKKRNRELFWNCEKLKSIR